jgi:hypothetical protein
LKICIINRFTNFLKGYYLFFQAPEDEFGFLFLLLEVLVVPQKVGSLNDYCKLELRLLALSGTIH